MEFRGNTGYPHKTLVPFPVEGKEMLESVNYAVLQFKWSTISPCKVNTFPWREVTRIRKSLARE